MDVGRRRLDLIVSGHTNVDLHLRVDAFPEEDRTVPVHSTDMTLGGTAANLALAASEQGLHVGLLSRVGGDFPVGFRRRLEKAGIDLGGLAVVPRARSPTCYIVVDARSRQRTLIDQGPMEDETEAALPPAWLRNTNWIHLTTAEPEFQLRVQREARRLGIRISVDPAQEIHYRWQPESLRRLLAGSDILFGKTDELEEAANLAGVPSVSHLLDRVPLVIETRGAEGARAYTRRGTFASPARSVRRLETLVGAGDAFRAGFYRAWFEGEPLSLCLRSGNQSAARWITRPHPPAG